MGDGERGGDRHQRDRVVVPGDRERHELAVTTIAMPNRTSRTRSAAISVTTTTATTTPTWIQRSDGAVHPGRLPDQRDRPDVARIDEPRPGARLDDGDVVEPDWTPPMSRLTATIARPGHDRRASRTRAFGPPRSRHARTATHRMSGAGWSLAMDATAIGDAARDLRPPRGPGQHREQQQAVRERVPGVEVAEQHGDRERQHERRDGDRADRHRERRAARVDRQPRGDQPEPERRADAPTAPARRRRGATRPGSSPGRPAAGTSRTARRRRATRPRASPGRTGSGRRGRAGRRRAAARGRSPPCGGSLWKQGPADPRDAGPRDDAGDHPGAEAVGVERVARGARRTLAMRSSRRHDTRSRDGVSSRVEGVARVANSYCRG